MLLAACSGGSDSSSIANQQDVNTSAASVERQEVTAPQPEASAAPQTQQAIQTQPGPAGAQVALNRVSVTGDLMTVQLTYTGGSGNNHAKLEEVSVIDDATAKQMGVLKDNAGKWLASPLNFNGQMLDVSLSDKPSVVWFKFPAPPAETKTVSINIPDVAPFDGVPVTR
jgi:hypothetical protein